MQRGKHYNFCIITRLLMMLICIPLFLFAETSQLPQRSDIDDKYKWNLELVYPDLESWEKDFEMLKNLKTQTIPETEIESLNQNISTLKDKIRSIDAVIDYLAQSYITGIQESQKFSDDAIERRLNRIILDRNLGENLRASLNGRLNLFKDHISLYEKEPQSVEKTNIVKDIISAY